MVTGIRRVSSARSASSWSQTGTHRQSVGVSKPGCISWERKQRRMRSKTQNRHQGENPHGCGVHITFQSLKSQQHFNVKGTSTSASAKQTSLYLKQGQVLWSPQYKDPAGGLFTASKSANSSPDTFLLFLLFVKACGFRNRRRIVFLIN